MQNFYKKYKKLIEEKTKSEEDVLSELYNEISNEDTKSVSLLNEFPIKEQLKIIDKFVNNCYAYYYNAGNKLFGIEILKLIYILWLKYKINDTLYENRPRVYPHKNFFELLYSIKSNLVTFYKMHLLNMPQDRHKKNMNYPYFNILGCLPLLNNNVSKPVYNTCSIDVYYKFDEVIKFYKNEGIDMLNDPDLHLFFINNIILKN